MSNANQIDFGQVSDLFLVAQGPLVASTSGVSSHPQQQQQQHQQQQQYHQQISSFQGLNLSIHHGLDLTCPNYQGLNLSLGQYVGVGLKAQAQKSSNSLPNPQQNSQSNQNNNSSNGRGLNLSQQQQGKSLPQQQHYQQQQQQQHLQQQQQQKVISNTNSGIRNNNNNLKRSEVGLNLSLQNGINLSSNRQQAPGPVDATSSNNSYYYTTNTSGGYINLSTQNYTSSALPSFTNNIGQTNSMQPSDGTAPQTSIFQSCTAEQTLRNSPLNLERNRSSPLNLTSAIPNGPFNPQQQLFPPRNEQQNYSQFCQNTPLDFQVLNYTDSSMVNGCSNNYEMFPTQQQQQNFQQQYTHSSANGGGTGGGGYINLSGQSFNIPVSNDQFQTLNCNVANSTNLNNEAVPVTSSANAKVHSVGGVVQQQNGNVPLIADKTNRNSPLNLERHRASPLNLTSAVPNGPFNSQLQPQQQQQHPTFEPRNEQHQQSFQQMCSTAPLDFQVLNFSDPGMGNSYDNTFEMFSTQDQQQQQQQFQPFSQPSMSGSGQGQGGSSSKIRLFCSTCCQEFSSSSELTRHMEKHTTANGLISNNGERYIIIIFCPLNSRCFIRVSLNLVSDTFVPPAVSR